MWRLWRWTNTSTTLPAVQALLLITILPLTGCLGQSVAFQWNFAISGPSSFFTPFLIECTAYPISLSSLSNNSSAIGSPPYFLMAFPPSGVPTTSNIGSDPSNLSWTVNQPAGSLLMLSVVDAHGDYGGHPSVFMTVVAGKSTLCEPSSPSKTISIATNFTSPVSTCQPLGFNITGGRKPYNFTLSALNSSVITRVMGADDDVFTYIDRALPNTQIMASVSDADGVWARSTQSFQTIGSTDSECPGLISSTSKSPPPPKRRSSAAVPISVSLVAVLLLLAATIVFFWRRWRHTRYFRKAGAAILPDAWFGPSSTPGLQEELALNTQGGSARSAHNLKRAAAISARYRYASGSFASQPLIPSDEQSPMDSSPDIVIQHRDGGRVQEIPPPYFDHDGTDRPSRSDASSAGESPPSEQTSQLE